MLHERKKYFEQFNEGKYSLKVPYQTGLYMLSKSEYIGLFMNILTFMS